MAGRPTKLTETVQKRIIDAILKGCDQVVAAKAAGVSERVFYLWVEKGRALEDAGQSGEDPGVYVQFVRAVEKARAEAEAQLVQIVREAAVTTWQAAAWMLERKHPERFGRRDRVDVHGARELVQDILTAAGLNAEEQREVADEVDAWLRGR